MTQRQTSVASGMPLRGSPEVHDRPRYYYPPVPTLRQPSAAHIQHAKTFSEGQTTESTRVQSSVSTASGSSGLSYTERQEPSPVSQWQSPTQERSLIHSKEQYHPSQHTHWQSMGSARPSHTLKHSETAASNPPAQAYIPKRRQIEQEDEDEEEEDHALWVLFWLSCLDPIYSLASCLFTLFVTFGLLLATPIRLFRKQSSFGDQIIRTLAPMFKNQCEMMYAASVDYAFEWDFRPGMLVSIHLISPLVSVGVALAAWITAAFWVFTSIMGNPDGTEKRDDGADAVLAVRNWWEKVLLLSLRPRVKPSMRSIV